MHVIVVAAKNHGMLTYLLALFGRVPGLCNTQLLALAAWGRPANWARFASRFASWASRGKRGPRQPFQVHAEEHTIGPAQHAVQAGDLQSASS